MLEAIEYYSNQRVGKTLLKGKGNPVYSHALTEWFTRPTILYFSDKSPDCILMLNSYAQTFEIELYRLRLSVGDFRENMLHILRASRGHHWLLIEDL